VVPWDTVRVFGTKIGIFGLTLQGPYPDYVRCGSPDSAAVVALDTLAAMQADLIVAITHQSLAADVALLNREGQLDLILGGTSMKHTRWLWAAATCSRRMRMPFPHSS
jgi:5'-nucleotidase